MTVRVKHVLVVLVAAVALTASVASVSADVERYAYCPFAFDTCGLPLVFEVDAQPKPETLPRREMAPIGLEARASISSADGGHPPALREVVIELDKNVKIDAARLPTCGLRQLEGQGAAAVRVACRDAIAGIGKAQIQTAPQNQRPIPVRVSLILINGGITGGSTKLFVHGEIPAPEPITIVSVARVEKARKGRYGHTATWKIPPILEGAGSLLGFSFELKRGYVRARCPDGKLQANITKALFRNEGEGPRTTTTLKGTVIRPCTPSPERVLKRQDPPERVESGEAGNHPAGD